MPINTGPSKKFKLKRNLQADMADEQEAVTNYGQRQQQLSGRPGLKKVIRGIQKQERGHKSKLQKVHRSV